PGDRFFEGRWPYREFGLSCSQRNAARSQKRKIVEKPGLVANLLGFSIASGLECQYRPFVHFECKYPREWGLHFFPFSPISTNRRMGPRPMGASTTKTGAAATATPVETATLLYRPDGMIQ